MITESMKKRLTALIDPEYERERNGPHDCYVKEAEKFANKQFGKKSPQGTTKVKAEWAARWNFCFHRKREELYRERKQNESREGS